MNPDMELIQLQMGKWNYYSGDKSTLDNARQEEFPDEWKTFIWGQMAYVYDNRIYKVHTIEEDGTVDSRWIPISKTKYLAKIGSQ